MIWLIIGLVVGFFLGFTTLLTVVEKVYADVYAEFMDGTWKVKWYNAKAKEAEDENKDELL